MRTRIILGLLLGLVATLGVIEVRAHLNVARTAPTDGSTVREAARIQVWFTQPPSPRVSRLDLEGPNGDVPLGELEIDRQDRSIAAPIAVALGAGTYEVTWRTAGNDGHVQQGTFTFSVAASE